MSSPRIALYASLVVICLLSAAIQSRADDYTCPGHITKSTYPNVASIPNPLRKAMDKYEERYVARVLSVIRDHTKSQQWIDQSDVNTAERRLTEGLRRQHFQELLAMDDNLDGQVTADEARAFYERAASTQPGLDVASSVIDLFHRYDLNGDGVISLQEMGHMTEQEERAAYKSVGLYYALPDWLALDPNHDGKLTVDELAALAHQAFRTVDTNGDGLLSQDEEKRLQAPNNSSK